MADRSADGIALAPRPGESLSARLRRGGAWVIVGRTLGIATTVLVGVALPRFVTPSDYAAFALLSSVMIFAGGLAMFGLNGTLVRFLAERLGQGDTVGAARALRVGFKLALATTVVVAIGTGVFLTVGGLSWFQLPADPVVILLVCAGVALLALQQLAAESLRGFHELRLASLLSGGQFGGPLTNILFLAGLLVAARTLSVEHLTMRITFGLFVASLLFTMPAAIVGLRRTAQASLSRDAAATRTAGSDRAELRAILPVCTPLMVMTGLSFAATQADMWIAGALCEKGDVALYYAARRLVVLVAMPLQLVNLTVMSSVPELFFQGRLAELQRLLRLAALAAAVPAVAGLAIMLWNPAWILGLFFGAYYRDAADLLLLLALGQLALVMAGSCALTLSLTGYQHTALRISLLSAALLVVAGPLATYFFGLRGLALAVVAATVTECALQWGMTRKLLGVWTHCAPWEAAVALQRWRAAQAQSALLPHPQAALSVAEPPSSACPSQLSAP